MKSVYLLSALSLLIMHKVHLAECVRKPFYVHFSDEMVERKHNGDTISHAVLLVDNEIPIMPFPLSPPSPPPTKIKKQEQRRPSPPPPPPPPACNYKRPPSPPLSSQPPPPKPKPRPPPPRVPSCVPRC